MTEGSPALGAQQDRGWTVADLFTALRLPMALAFLVAPGHGWRLGILAAAGITDLLDGQLARRYGSSRLGALLDPVADKIFMACAFGLVIVSGRLEWWEIGAVLVRDIVAAVAFGVTMISGRAAAIPARLGGKAVTVGQFLTLAAFLLDSTRYLRPLAWATGAVGLYAIWDYTRAAGAEKRPVGRA